MTNETLPNVASMMTPEQQHLIDQEKASDGSIRGATLTGPYIMTRKFHHEMLMEIPDKPIMPTVAHRERRLRLILEEYLELVEAMGFDLVNDFGHRLNHGGIKVEHSEGSRYDVVETADALGDLNVVVNGTAVDFGIPQEEIDYEIFCSNMTKLDSETGKPIINGKTPGYRVGNEQPMLEEGEVEFDEPGYRPEFPVGKILKPEGYTKPNIVRVLVESETRKGN